MCRGNRSRRAVLVCVLFINVVFGGSLKEVEKIPDEQKTAGSELLGPSLSLDKNNKVDSDRKRRAYVDPKYEEIEDHIAEASGILGPGISLGHGGGGHSGYGQHQGYGGFGQGYGGQGGENYGLNKGGEQVYGSQNLGNSQGEVGFYGNTGQRGTSGQESLGKFGGSQLGSRGNQAGSGYYGDLAGVKKGYNVANGYGGEQSYNKNGQAVQGVGAKGGHRKGHQTSGFTNSYHKDETGKTSNFFDDGLDEGTHYDYGKTGGEFRDGAGNAYRGGQEDGTYLSNQQGRQGNFDSAAGYNDEQGQKGLFGRGQFYNDQAKYGLDKGGKRYGENAYGGQQQRAGNFYDKAGGTFGENVAHDGYGGGQHFGGYEVPLTGYGYYDAKASNLQPVDYYPDGARSYGALYSRHGEKAPYVTAVPYNHYGDEAVHTVGAGVARKGIGLATFVEPITYVGDKESDIRYYDEPVPYSSSGY